MNAFSTRMASFGGHQSITAGSHPLSDDEIRARAPAIFATQAHESRSERFGYVPTYEVLAGMRAEGFLPVTVLQGRSRIEGKASFTKHLLRFRRDGEVGKVGSVPEVILVNAHDGTSSYQMMSGLFVFTCSNGLITMSRDDGSFKIKHTRNAVADVIDASFTVVENSRKALETAEAWTGLTLDHDEAMALAEAAHVLRFADAEGVVKTPIQPAQLLLPRRQEDRGTDLYTRTNVLQENVLRGGLSAMGRDLNNQRRRVTTRDIGGIDETVRLNRALWTLSTRMAELKGVAA